jgi:hypothetical protein
MDKSINDEHAPSGSSALEIIGRLIAFAKTLHEDEEFVMKALLVAHDTMSADRWAAWRLACLSKR